MVNSGLGRGLGSLIPSKKPTNEPEHIGAMLGASDKNRSLEIEIERIETNPYQPRQRFSEAPMDELVQSIKEYGIIQPLVVCRKNDKYELIAGERRLRAAKEAGLKKVPAIIRDSDKQEKMEIALVENIQRENLNPIDLAQGYKRLADEFGLSQEEVAKKVGKSRSSVTNSLRMLLLPDSIRQALAEGRITEGHGKYLAGLEGEEKQLSLFNKIVRNQLSVADTSKAARSSGGTKEARIKINYRDKDKEFAFREFFGSKVEVRRKKKGGEIIINFFSDEELDILVAKIKKPPIQ